MIAKQLILIVSISLIISLPMFGVSSPIKEHSFKPALQGVDPVSWWEFNEGEGTTALDSQENNNDGSLIGCSWTAGHVDGALKFNGEADFVEFNASSSVKTINNEFSIEILTKISSYGSENGNTLFMMSTSLRG
ncbi:MAG: hypothetical protein RTU30_04530 [Candidatus Thorarchaeota archaeon]